LSILFIPGKFNSHIWLKALRLTLENHGLSARIQLWPNVDDVDSVEFAMIWNHPFGELKKYPNLKCISSLGAGVDHILCDPDLPPNIPITRVVDKYLTQDMTNYVIWAVLNYARHFDFYAKSQERHLWTPRALSERPNVGIMGLGQLGFDAAVKLRDLGFVVRSWSRTAKDVEGIAHFHGEEQKVDFLNGTNILVCLLPLTPETKNILNIDTFYQLPKDAYVINAARGEHLSAKDLLAALEAGHLSGACLDVFEKEPLPSEHPLWQNPKVKVTPHIASVSDAYSVAEQLTDNYQRMLTKQPLQNVVDVSKGY
jgi:glyoxylate/hydroxypyruvate reductase A